MIQRRSLGITLTCGLLWLLAAPAAHGQTVAPDSVRTNLWLAESLMAEIATAAAVVLPPPPAAVRLAPADAEAATELFGAEAVRVLRGRGYEIYAAQEDPAQTAAADVDLSYRILDVKLAYPETGRTLGIWRRWVGRDMTVTAMVQVTEPASGRVLLHEKISRSFGDRVPNDHFEAVESDLYPFTSAETTDNNWQGRLEAVVVLGALVGLVAIYFANTQN